MTIDKAIKTLEFRLSKSALEVGPGLRKATKLGIEALKRELEARKDCHSDEVMLLPGETK